MINPQLVTAVLVTRGDVNMQPILDSLPEGMHVVIWNNAERPVNYGVSGRYVALAEVRTPVVFFQDDDCLLSPDAFEQLLAAYEPGLVVGNAEDNPERLAKYHDTTLLGWGSLFDRDLPSIAFAHYARFFPFAELFDDGHGAEIVFPMLSATRTITAGFDWLEDDGPVFRRDNRMWLQKGFYERLEYWMDRARQARALMESGQ